jgi:hypothetical protein
MPGSIIQGDIDAGPMSFELIDPTTEGLYLLRLPARDNLTGEGDVYFSCSVGHPRSHAPASPSGAKTEPGTGIAVESLLQFHPFTAHPLLNVFHGGRGHREGQPIDAEQKPVETRLVLAGVQFLPP